MKEREILLKANTDVGKGITPKALLCNLDHLMKKSVQRKLGKAQRVLRKCVAGRELHFRKITLPEVQSNQN